MTMEGYVIMMNCMTRRVKVTRKDGENTTDGVTRKDGENTTDGVTRKDGENTTDGVTRKDGVTMR